MSYLVQKNLHSKTKATKKYMLTDILFILIYVGSGLFLQELVSDKIVWGFHIFNVFMAVTLIGKSKVNPGKRYYHTVYFYLIRNISTYHPVRNDSKDILRKELLDEIKTEN